MTTVGQPIARCVLGWLLLQSSAILKNIKAILLALIVQIDIQILILRAQLAQMDILAKGEQAAWSLVEGFVDKAKAAITAFPAGPGQDSCPEFYEYFTDPLVGMLETNLGALTPIHERLNNKLSFIDELDQLLAYWEATKEKLLALIDLIDEATLVALAREAEEVP